MEKGLVPDNKKGKQLDSKVEVECESEEAAIALFQTACSRLLHPHTWKTMTGVFGATFEAPSERKVKVGDYIQIDIPGPGSLVGRGYDWVKVEVVEENPSFNADQSLGLKLIVCENPEQPQNETAHFFATGASSTFIIELKGKQVAAFYHGRNEVPNVENEGIVDKVRNVAVALGAIAGISELQWRAFLKGMLASEA